MAAMAYLHFVVPKLPLPNPADGPRPDYAATAGPTGYAAVALAAILSSLVVGHFLPSSTWWPWFGYLAVGTPLVWVDLKTTYLPIQPTRLCGLLIMLGVLFGALWSPWSLLWALVGGLAAFGMFYAIWRFSGSLGFGDVRLAAIIGVLAGAQGMQFWCYAVLLGTIIGGGWGVINWIRHRDSKRIFPYGPALWLGPIAAIPFAV